MKTKLTRTLGVTLSALSTIALLAGCSSAPAAGEGKDARVALILPGPDAYFEPWEQAASDVGEEYGFEAIFSAPASEWDLNQQNALADSLAAKGYNGFGFFPGDANGTNAEQQKLADRGIPSININGCTQDPGPSLFCISTNVYEAAKYQAEQLIEAIGGEGNIALLTSELTDSNTQLRISAVEEAVAATNGKVVLVQTLADINTPQTATPAINALLASEGATLEGVMSTSYNPSVAMATALTDSPEFRQIVFIGAENAPQVMEALEKGYIYGTLFQNTYGMAYAAGYALHKVIEEGCTVSKSAPFDSTDQTEKLLTADVLLVTNENSAEFIGKPESLPDDTERLMALIDDEVLAC
jgi:ribose transport system substrate-binding protein